MKTKFLIILLTFVTIFFIACDEDSITEAVLGSNSITLSGDITDSFDAPAFGGLSVEDSMFIVTMSPNFNSQVYENILLLGLETATLPEVRTYNVGVDEMNQNEFRAIFTRNDSTTYMMSSGTVKITSSSSSKIEGTFDMKGPLFSFDQTGDSELIIKGEFSTTPIIE